MPVTAFIGGAIQVEYLGNSTSGVGGSSVSLPFASFGTESASRLLVAGIFHSSDGNFTANPTVVTIGGVSATTAVRSAPGLGVLNSSIWYAVVPTGTSGNVFIDVSAGGGNATADRYGAFLWKLTGYGSTTPRDTDSDSRIGVLTMNIDCPAGGVILSLGGQRGSASGSYTWTTLNEDDDISIGGEVPGTAAHLATTTTLTNEAITLTCTVNQNNSVAAASWR